MNAHSHARHNVGLLAIISILLFLLLVPNAEAGRERDTEDRWSRNHNERPTYEERFCNHIAKAYERRGWELPDFCEGDEPDPEPEPEEPNLDFDAESLTVPAGSTTTLTWLSEFADSCEASDGWSGDKALSGSEIVTVNVDTTYTLTCTGEGGEAIESVMVEVEDEEPGPEAPTVSIIADPDTVAANGTTTLMWDSENADSCEAEDSWSGIKATSSSEVVTVGTSTATYTITCTGAGGSASDSVVVTVEEPDPEPAVDHVLISEVLYDLGDGQGSETGGANEWVEIYNPTDSPVDLMDWEIGDGSSNDVISDTSLILGPGTYLVITNSTTTANFWDFTGVTVVFLESSISGGLANGGDSVKLFDASDAEVDAVSYGSDISVFDPSVAGVSAGNSIERTALDADTDTAADWSANDAPSPGS